MSSSPTSVESAAAARPKRKKWLIWAFQIVVTCLVILFVARQLQIALDELKASRASLADIRWGWLLSASLLYFASLLPAGEFWRKCLVALGNQPSLARAHRAYLIGGVGKYVPGKAAVVFLRTILVAGKHCSAGSAGIAVFIETLTMMGVGGFLSALVVMLLFREHWWIALLSVGLAIAVIAPTIPHVTRQIVKVIRLKRLSGDIMERLEGWNTSLIARGWLLESANWIFQALSVWVCLRALPESFFETSAQRLAAESWFHSFPLLLVSTAVSTVVGFLLLIPAGLGVREILVLNMLAPAIGHPAATTVSVLSRLVMIFVDVLLAAALYPIPSRDDHDRDPAALSLSAPSSTPAH